MYNRIPYNKNKIYVFIIFLPLMWTVQREYMYNNEIVLAIWVYFMIQLAFMKVV